ncbi:MAG TPA: glycosyltransferase family 25 protein [Vicinamibacterales bacterium]|nr:glycosyltransferase family 25 protein [Vicinamibacterales bacterium]
MTATPYRADGLDRWFTHKVCLNLDRRAERWARMRERFARHGISDVVRFSAVDGEHADVPASWRGTAGAYGCLQSNLAVVTEARDRNWPDVLLFEDDVVFDDDLNVKLPGFMAQLPSDWDMLFFGGMHREAPLRVRENIVKLTGSTSTYAYAVRSTIYHAFLETHARSLEPIDVRNRQLQERFNCYCFIPHLAWVEGGESDTQGRPVNPWWLRESLILGGGTIDDLQTRTLVVIAHDDAGGNGELARRNLAYTSRAYRRHLPHAAIVIVGQEADPDPGLLPPGCEYVALGHGEAFDMGRCFNAGIAELGHDREFYVCADRDIVPTWDLRAHLLKCRDYDLASSARDMIDLTADDSERVVSQKSHAGIDYATRLRHGFCAEGCVITRDGFQRSGGWHQIGRRKSRTAPSLRRLDRLSLFDSPALGLRLFAGDHAANSPRRAC